MKTKETWDEYVARRERQREEINKANAKCYNKLSYSDKKQLLKKFAHPVYFLRERTKCEAIEGFMSSDDFYLDKNSKRIRSRSGERRGFVQTILTKAEFNYCLLLDECKTRAALLKAYSGYISHSV